MNHFLARIGRNARNKQATVALGPLLGSLYLTYNIYGHGITRKILCSEEKPGQYSELSDKLQNLIRSVVHECCQFLGEASIMGRFDREEPFKIKWFSSSTMDPISVGFSGTIAGVTIGLPSYYNHETQDSFDDNFFRLKKFKLFKSFSHTNKSPEDSKNDTDLYEDGDNEFVEVLKLDRRSPHVQNYIQALILSEDAKKFSIARELFKADTEQPLLTMINIIASCFIALSVSRLSISALKISYSHVTHRIPCHFIAICIAVINYDFIDSVIDDHFTKLADARAARIGDQYKNGAMEYLNKLLARNRALRAISDDYKSAYDVNGEPSKSLSKYFKTSIQERIEKLQHIDSGINKG